MSRIPTATSSALAAVRQCKRKVVLNADYADDADLIRVIRVYLRRKTLILNALHSVGPGKFSSFLRRGVDPRDPDIR